MDWLFGLFIGIYSLGFALTVLANPWWCSPITFGLSMLRAAVWPLYWLTGWPNGERF